MSNRSNSQRIGDLGEALVSFQVEKTGGWIARKQEKDYGIDMEIELAHPIIEGQIIKFQVKTSENDEYSQGKIKRRLSRKFLKYTYECKIPIILVLSFRTIALRTESRKLNNIWVGVSPLATLIRLFRKPLSKVCSNGISI